MTTESLIYACCMSEFNLAELEACLTLKPRHVVLVVSTFGAAQRGAERFEAVMKESLPDTQVHRPDRQHGFGGEDLLEFQRWSKQHLRSMLEQLDEDGKQPWVLNATGGTKAMSMTLLMALPWSQVHYKGIHTRSLQTMALLNNEWVPRGKDITLEDALASQVVQLYAYVNPKKLITSQCPDPDKRILAQAIWDGLQSQDEHLLALFDWLDGIWSQGRDNPEYNHNQLRLSAPAALMMPGIEYWLEQLASLHPEMFLISGGDDACITIPGNKGNNKKIEKVRRWISGIWLEELAYHWLHDAGINDDKMIASLASSPEQEEGTDRESDLFVHYQGRSSLIEIKADVPDGDYRSVEDQINSFGDRLGRTRKILLIGPDFRATLQKNPQYGHWQRFEKRLKASRITLCENREQLLEAFGLSATTST